MKIDDDNKDEKNDKNEKQNLIITRLRNEMNNDVKKTIC